MSCNPSIGGVGKGHLVREVDALDGIMARAADVAAIHHRTLNASKGAAVHGPRVQADRTLYRGAVQRLLAEHDQVAVRRGEADDLIVKRHECVGVRLSDGSDIRGATVVLATGTFLGGRIFRGDERLAGGRVGERPATVLASRLRALGMPVRRLKTGTPPRLDGRTINWARLSPQPSDTGVWTMSPMTPGRSVPQLACAITRTNAATHDAIRQGLADSPLLNGDIEGLGPRYCPSIEDKITRFGESRRSPDFPRARGANRSNRLPERHLHLALCSHAAPSPPHDRGPGACGDHPTWVRRRIRPYRSPLARSRLGHDRPAGSFLRRADQWHDRI